MATATKPQPQVLAPEVEVGSIFECSWGYDQTNVDYYKVVSRTAKMVKVVQVRTTSMGSGHFTQDKVVPSDEPVKGGWVVKEARTGNYFDDREYDPEHVEVTAHRLKVWEGPNGRTVSFAVNSFSSAYLWDGKPAYQTAAGFGH